jgi:4-diphosphocytidyl-2-C-methyl-D-erythritol kinase
LEDQYVSSYAWPAPGKINLFLHVTGQRSDGYHLLQTVFQFINFVDLLDFHDRSDGKLLRTANYDGINQETDMTILAAQALQVETGCKRGVEIHINKKLPIGGGLGGGSSNTATTLIALNKLWDLGLTVEKIVEIGLRLGADVPVFVHGSAAWAEGVGERLTPIEPRESWYLIVKPDCHVSTARVFGSTDLTRNTPPITIRDFLKSGGHNDCEPVVRHYYPAHDVDGRILFCGIRKPGTGTGGK